MEHDEALKVASRYSIETYGKAYGEVFGYSQSTEEILENIEIMKGKKAFLDRTEKIDTDDSKFLILWRQFWNRRVVSQSILCELYAMCALSQLLKHVRIIKSGGTKDDIRIHVCNIMPSGTGKSEANDCLATFARKMSLSYSSVDRYNDAALVGSINRQAVDHNMRNNLREGDEGYIIPDEIGILRRTDFAVFDEGENILKTTNTTEGAQRYLQKAMNRHGSEGNLVTNTLVSHTVGGYPNCSVVITSYYLDDFKETLLYRGLLQRMIVYIQDEDYEKRTKILEATIDGIPSYSTNPNEAISKIPEMVASGEYILNLIEEECRSIVEYHRDVESMVISDAAKEITKESVTQLREIMPFLVGQKQLWESMITRMTNNMLKVSAIHALMNRRRNIEESDAIYAADLMIQTMKSMAFFMKDNLKTPMDEKTNKFYRNLRRVAIGEKRTMDEWVDYSIEKLEVSKNRAMMFIQNLYENRKFKEIAQQEGLPTILYLE